jgi:hypothetical protein
MFTLFSRRASASPLAPSSWILLCERLSVVRFYERKVNMWTTKIRRRRFSPCFVWKHQPVLWFVHRRTDKIWDWLLLMSMREKWRCWKKIRRKCFTLFSRKTSANALAPWSSISILSTLSVVSVYEKKVKMLTRKIRKEGCSPYFLWEH